MQTQELSQQWWLLTLHIQGCNEKEKFRIQNFHPKIRGNVKKSHARWDLKMISFCTFTIYCRSHADVKHRKLLISSTEKTFRKLIKLIHRLHCVFITRVWLSRSSSRWFSCHKNKKNSANMINDVWFYELLWLGKVKRSKKIVVLTF